MHSISRVAIAAIAGILVASFVTPETVSAQIVTRDEARVVASNWIALVTGLTGGWGGSSTASVGEIEELRRGGRRLGYWCHIEPTGHVVVSLRRELAPVKAASETWDGDPSCDADIVDVIKRKIEQEHDYIEARLGSIETAPPAGIEALLEISCRDEWRMLSGHPEDFRSVMASIPALADYQEGMVLLETNWNQCHPYNLYMPSNTTDCNDYYDFRCATGCTSLAASQIMKYWNWPPYGMGSPYDDYYFWTAMPNELTSESPFEQVNPVTVLIAEVGQSFQTAYCNNGCASSASIENALAGYTGNFRFHHATAILNRLNFESGEWFSLIQTNINYNSPVHYRIPNHHIVCDGWRVVSTIKQYHMNYGWGNNLGDESCWDPYIETGSNTWFTLDLLPCPDLAEESIIGWLYPSVSLHNTLSGTYAPNPDFPWWYVNMDTGGESAVFSAGQMIQSLPGMTVGCTSATGGSIRFYGSTDHHTRIFARGDRTKGVKITGGGVALYGPASMVVR